MSTWQLPRHNEEKTSHPSPTPQNNNRNSNKNNKESQKKNTGHLCPIYQGEYKSLHPFGKEFLNHRTVSNIFFFQFAIGEQLIYIKKEKEKEKNKKGEKRLSNQISLNESKDK